MDPSSDTGESRRFGLLVAAIALGVGCWPVVARGQTPRAAALAVAALLLVLALAAPRSLRVPRRWSVALGEAMGRLNAWLILSLVFYLLVTPIGILRRLRGADPMGRRHDRAAGSYRVPRAPRPPDHLTRQF
jgi:hypothetical protein